MNETSRLGAAVDPPVALAPVRFADAYSPIIAFVAIGISLGIGWRMSALPDQARNVVYPLAFGIIFTAFGWRLLLLRQRERGTLALYEEGFSWTRAGWPGKTAAFRFDEVESLAVSEADWTGDAGTEGLWRQIEARGTAGRIRFRNTALSEQPDAMGAFLDALLDRLADATEARMRSGRPLTGERWSLGVDGFRGGQEKNAALPVAMSDLARVDLVKKKKATKKVSLWRTGEEQPFFTVRSKGPNALVLARILERRLAPHRG